jgi:hypothetical protein
MYNSALQRNQTGQTNVDASLHFHWCLPGPDNYFAHFYAENSMLK